MALAFSNRVLPLKKAGGYKVVISRVTLDATYAQGGYAVSASDVGLGTGGTIVDVIVGGGAAAGISDTGFLGVWDSANGKLKVYNIGGGTDAFAEADTNEANLTGNLLRLFVIGY